MPIAPDTRFSLVHVGKCGGSSVVHELLRREFRFEHVHMRRPAIGPDHRYVILVRDPVARFISAFNWRRHMLGADLLPAALKENPLNRLKQQAEWSFLSSFQNVNECAEQWVAGGEHEVSAIGTMMGLVTHVPQGFSWYLDDLLDHVSAVQLLGVIALEHFDDDFDHLFGFRPSAEQHRHYPDSGRDLSTLGRANLEREFAAEYQSLDRLAALAGRAGVRMSVAYGTATGTGENLP